VGGIIRQGDTRTAFSIQAIENRRQLLAERIAVEGEAFSSSPTLRLRAGSDQLTF
jgi:hypothetical protein